MYVHVFTLLSGLLPPCQGWAVDHGHASKQHLANTELTMLELIILPLQVGLSTNNEQRERTVTQ